MDYDSGETDSETNSEIGTQNIDNEDNNEDNTNPLLISSIVKSNYNSSYHLLQPMKNVFIIFGKTTCNTCKIIFKLSWVYILWIIAHYVASHLYIQMCVPTTFYGFIVSPFVAVSPHCQGLRWIVYNAGTNINNMWIAFGLWLQNHIMNISN
jgi:hypothetical protein